MNSATAPFSRNQLRGFYGGIPTGVIALASGSKGQAIAMTVCSFTTVSLEPPLIVAAIRNESNTWSRLKSIRRIGGSVLAHNQASLARQMSVGDSEKRLDNISVTETGTGALFVDGASSWFEAELAEEHSAGDHYLAILKLQAFMVDDDLTSTPLIFHDSEFVSVKEELAS